MKKEEERKEKDKNQEDKVSGSGSDIGEVGVEYEFFITEDAKAKEELSNGVDPRETVKRENNTDQSKTFFLPDFFPTKISFPCVVKLSNFESVDGFLSLLCRPPIPRIDE
jgi:hypothetical protein